MQPKFIDHIVLIIKNIEETEKFYNSFLGKPEQQDKEQVAYKIGETKIFFGLAYGDFEKSDKDKTSLNHLAFGVRSMEELREFEQTLNNSGIKNSGIMNDKYGNKEFIWFDDPNGYRLEIYCRPE
ncbi:MAG TPA: VOC family protein [Candidatus Paceibacterota bacterium]